MPRGASPKREREYRKLKHEFYNPDGTKGARKKLLRVS
jgi:hypothetical protein